MEVPVKQFLTVYGLTWQEGENFLPLFHYSPAKPFSPFTNGIEWGKRSHIFSSFRHLLGNRYFLKK